MTTLQGFWIACESGRTELKNVIDTVNGNALTGLDGHLIAQVFGPGHLP